MRVIPSEIEARERQPATTAELAGLAADSRTVAVWTLVSRITGFGRVAAIAAVLGPTYFGNLFQTANSLPHVVHELLVGSLITGLLVPPIVRHVDARDPLAARRLANGFLGLAALAGAAAALLCFGAAPLLLFLMTAAVDLPEVREQQSELGAPLVALVLPQIVLYGVIATGVAVQNAHRRFALPAAAPAVENVGIMAVMGASAVLYGVGLDVGQVSVPQVLLLGGGSTAAVAAHAAVQWYGAYRVGVPLVPRAGWRDPEVRAIIRLAVPSSGHAALNCATFFALLVVAGAVPGGTVAFQIGWYFFNLPIALCARPLAAAQLPRLSRSFNEGTFAAFLATYRNSLGLALFVAIPASVLFLSMPGTWARAVAFGEMDTGLGVALITAVIATLGAGIIGETIMIVATSASYARRDAVSPLLAIIIRAAVAFGGMAIAFTLMSGTAVLWTLGAAVSAANLIAAAYLHHRQVRKRPHGRWAGGLQVLGDLAAAAVTIPPGMLLAARLDAAIEAPYGGMVTAIAVLALSAAVYLSIQWLRGSEQLKSLFSAGRELVLDNTATDGALGGDRGRAEPSC
jgi:putative peptidoglycan lipid II flippase